MSRDARLTDPTMLLQAAGDNKEVFRCLLRLFIAIFPAMLDRLQLYFVAQDLPSLAQQAHCVKGYLYLVGAMSSADRVEVIEVAARGDKALCSRDEFEQMIDEMRSLIEEVEGDLKPVMPCSAEEIC